MVAISRVVESYLKCESRKSYDEVALSELLWPPKTNLEQKAISKKMEFSSDWIRKTYSLRLLSHKYI